MNGNQPERSSGKIMRMAEWLDAKLTPTLGGPPLGPYGEEPDVAQRLANAVCPICGHPMGEHQIDHSPRNAILTCPVATEPREESFEPLNEVGMTKRAPSTEQPAGQFISPTIQMSSLAQSGSVQASPKD